MARRRRSYISRKEEKQNIRKAYIFVFLSLIGVATILVFGIPALAKFAGFLGGFRESGQPVEINDTTPPVTPRFDILPEATNDQRLEIRGNTEAGATIEINFNNSKEEIIADNTGQFSTILTLSPGSNSFTAIAKDNSGNISSETPVYKIVYDTNAPSLEITAPEDGSQYYGSKQRQVVIEGKTESDSEVRINDRFVVVESDGSFSFATSLQEGENLFLIRSEDTAGNSTEATLTLHYTP